MNKYDFDFKRIEDVLYDVLGIVNPTDIMSLKMQIRENLNALSHAIDEKCSQFKNVQEDKVELQKSALYKELDAIATETDLDTILRKCVTIRYLTLLSLEVKIREEDSFEVKSQKKTRRNEIFAVSDLVKSVPSITEFMKKRNFLLSYIDSEGRAIKCDKTPSNQDEQYPEMKLDIQLQPKQIEFPEKYKNVFEKSEIYAYIFGDLICSALPDENGNYIQVVSRKKIVGVIKKDEFNELKKYSILMDDISEEIQPEFYRDILFSDMILRNANNNLGLLGVPEKMPEDNPYGYRISFKDSGLLEMFKALHLENNPDIVAVNSNFSRVNSVNDVYRLMQEKMGKLEKVFSEKDNGDKVIGDD